MVKLKKRIFSNMPSEKNVSLVRLFGRQDARQLTSWIRAIKGVIFSLCEVWRNLWSPTRALSMDRGGRNSHEERVWHMETRRFFFID